MDPVEERLVLPFYLKMMRENAIEGASELWGSLVIAGREAELDEVQRLLRLGAWRPVVMGAWFSLRFTADQVGQDLLGAIDRCFGSLAAPPLAVVAGELVG